MPGSEETLTEMERAAWSGSPGDTFEEFGVPKMFVHVRTGAAASPERFFGAVWPGAFVCFLPNHYPGLQMFINGVLVRRRQTSVDVA